MCLALLAYALGVLWSLRYDIIKEFDTSTHRVAVMVNDFVILSSITSIVGYLIFKKSLALELVSALRAFRHSCEIPRTKRFRNVVMVFVMAGYLACHVTIVGLYGPANTLDVPLYYIIKETFEMSVWLLIDGFTIGFYFAIVSFMSDVHDDLFASLSQLQPTCLTISATISSSDNALADTTTDRPPNSPCHTDETLQKVSKSLVRLHDLHRLLHRYMGFPITMSMQVSITSTILSLFYLTYWPSTDAEAKVLCVAYIVISAVPAVVLCNVPEMLKSRVSNDYHNG